MNRRVQVAFLIIIVLCISSYSFAQWGPMPPPPPPPTGASAGHSWWNPLAWWDGVHDFLGGITKAVYEGLKTAANYLIETTWYWAKQFVWSCLDWVVELLGYFLKPFISGFLHFMPDPNGLGMVYVFQVYKWLSTVIALDVLVDVATFYISLHMLSITIYLLTITIEFLRRLWEAIPFVG